MTEPTLSPAERHVLEHAIAWLHDRRPLFRNHYVTSPDCDDWATVQALCARGLMQVRHPALGSSGMASFSVTNVGIRELHAQPDQPKRTKAAQQCLDRELARLFIYEGVSQ